MTPSPPPPFFPQSGGGLEKGEEEDDLLDLSDDEDFVRLQAQGADALFKGLFRLCAVKG